MNDDRAVGYLTARTGRLILALAMIGLALAAGVNAFANIWRAHRPDRVLSVFPDDPIALLNAEDHRWIATMGVAGGSREAAMAAGRALRDEPLTPAAFRLLGFAETAAGHAARARTVMTLAHRLSRRDAGTSVWLIHDSAARGDMQATLRYYDEALLTSPETSAVLFPSLAAALFDPAVRHALSIYVRDRPSWMPRFLRFAAEATPTPDHVAELVIEAGGLPTTSEYDGVHARILGQLADKGSIMLARSYLRHVVGIAPGIVGDPRFTPQTTAPILGPFAWRFIDQPEIGSALDDRGALQVRVATDRLGMVARRMLIAGAGTHDFAQSVTFPPGAPMAHLRWEMRCIPAAAVEPVWSQDVPAAAARTIYTAAITIPDHCPAQELSLIARNDSAQEEAEATISALTLKPHPALK